MAKIFAPFTDEQVKLLKGWQSGEATFETIIGESGPNPLTLMAPPHPFTCCSHEGCDRQSQPNQGTLIPSKDGFICPCGKYTQKWCHDFMVQYK